MRGGEHCIKAARQHQRIGFVRTFFREMARPRMPFWRPWLRSSCFQEGKNRVCRHFGSRLRFDAPSSHQRKPQDGRSARDEQCIVPCSGARKQSGRRNHVLMHASIDLFLVSWVNLRFPRRSQSIATLTGPPDWGCENMPGAPACPSSPLNRMVRFPIEAGPGNAANACIVISGTIARMIRSTALSKNRDPWVPSNRMYPFCGICNAILETVHVLLP
jgi:hypothetical protein